MTKEEAKEIIEDLKYSLDISLIGTPEINEIDNAMAMAIKSLETIQRIDDVLNVEGMPEIDILDEVMDAVNEFKYDCGVSE